MSYEKIRLKQSLIRKSGGQYLGPLDLTIATPDQIRAERDKLWTPPKPRERPTSQIPLGKKIDINSGTGNPI